MLYKRWLYIFLAITSLYPLGTIAQDSIVDQEVQVNQQVWLDYNSLTRLSETQSIRTQFGFRKISPEVYDRFLMMPTWIIENKSAGHFLGLNKSLIESYRFGAGAIYTSNYDARDNLELRLSQGILVDVPMINNITLRNYARIEERFQNSFDDSGWQSGFRFRYRLSTVLSWKNHLIRFTEGFYLPMEAEIFANLKKSDRFNDLLRLSPGIGYQLKNKWRIELYLIYNRTKNITETTDKSTNDFIMRIRVYNGEKLKHPAVPPEEPTFD
ncbi:MAG: DUF2490 domain-containing protein [Maribacter sp.]|nr:DUF2490 domain-containing protein [Maribacter sp.]